MDDFSKASIEVKDSLILSSLSWKKIENNCQPRIVCPVKISFKNEDKNKDIFRQLSLLPADPC